MKAIWRRLEGQPRVPTPNPHPRAPLLPRSDRYNARAFVNKGCVLAERGDLEVGGSVGINGGCVVISKAKWH